MLVPPSTGPFRVPKVLIDANLARRRIIVVEKKPNSKRKSAPKRVLRLPDLNHAKRTVLNSLGSPDSTRAYAFAIDDFIAWCCSV